MSSRCHCAGPVDHRPGAAFTAVNGVIFDAGEEIGWLDEEGRFRGVSIDGDHFEGSLIS